MKDAQKNENPQIFFNPQYAKGSCGVGFVARLDSVPSHEIVEQAVQVLCNLKHRGAVGGDRSTGDGAGIMIQIPHAFFQRHGGLDRKLPDKGDYAVGMFFMPPDAENRRRCIASIERIAAETGLGIIGWRDLPVNPEKLGNLARKTRPGICQLFLHRQEIAPEKFELKLYILRRRIEKEIESLAGSDTGQFYCVSLSSRTITYKGLLTGTQLNDFFPDLINPDFESAFGIVHERYSTNTLPSWALAQPFRFLAHNGEINTLRGNINRMRGRETKLASPFFGPDIDQIKPVLVESGSDSAILDNALELLINGGRSLPHSMMMLVPEAWSRKIYMSEDKRSFYEYHSALMEPWDGPASLVFTDGRYIGAQLDRNGLRPARYTVTRDGLVVLASESGVLEIPADRILFRGQVQPGRMFLVDLNEHRIIPDHEIKLKISRQKPYRNWVKENQIELRGLLSPPEHSLEPDKTVSRQQHLFGYSLEELKMVITPMASNGQEAVGSMGNDTPLAVLSEKPQLLFSYFKQIFAQVTNPPIDPLREELVMSLMSYIGRTGNLLSEEPKNISMLKLNHPILTSEDVERLKKSSHPRLKAGVIDMLFPADGDGAALEKALADIFIKAEEHIKNGATILILTDRNADSEHAAIPSLLAGSGLHHHLIRKGLRTSAAIIMETGEAREVIHFAMLIAFGVNAVCPYTAYSTIRLLSSNGLLYGVNTAEEGFDNYITAVKKGLLKTFSRLGISTVRSFFGSQTFEALGLSVELIDRYFPGTSSRIGGIGIDEIASDSRIRHAAAFRNPNGLDLIDIGGSYHWRKNGERHLLSPEVIVLLQRAVRENDYEIFKKYSRLIDDQSKAHITIRSLLEFSSGQPVPLEEVEPISEIVKRFVVSAMSFGALSREAHETISIAANRIGAFSNSGEGGEDPARNTRLPSGDLPASRVRQVASGRFGITTEYLINADELQIKIAQGAKPGEGGQLPGYKVSEYIARVRHTTQGVTLISPPPHHDIYSIEDISQLIYDLKCVNPRARISVKLVSESGVGTVATGVAKGRADAVLISGSDGGTGASPLTAIRHTGLPWEIGLAETQYMLRRAGLRDRIRVQVDGQLRTGRDLAIAALLGAEEFGFATIILVAMGCTMMRKCHLNTCPFGIATQDEALRKQFKGRPEHIINFFTYIARELREQMASLGFRTIDEMVGHADRLKFRRDMLNGKSAMLDLSPLLNSDDETVAPLKCTRLEWREPAQCFDDELLQKLRPAIEERKQMRLELPIRNIHRTVGARLSGEIVKRYGPGGLPDNTISVTFRGSAGQSFGSFLAPGVTFRVEGDVNDYLGKGMTGGRIIAVPPPDAGLSSHENAIAGNVVLYGATGGEIYLAGTACARFCVRNSGACAVVEGAGDHGCEYMTGGVAVVLGPTGINFAAGMSGGLAYVYDPTGLFDTRCNLDMVDLKGVHYAEDVRQLRGFIERHLEYTGSIRAKMILDNWATQLPFFVKVLPIEYEHSLKRMGQRLHREDDTLSATEEVFQNVKTGRIPAIRP